MVIAKHFVVEITAKARCVLKPDFDYAPIGWAQEPRGGLGGLGTRYITQTQRNRQWGCSYGLHNRSRQGSRPGRRARESASSKHGIKEVRVRRLALSRRHTPALLAWLASL